MNFPRFKTVCITGLSLLGLLLPIRVCALEGSSSSSTGAHLDSDDSESPRSAESIVIPGSLRSFLRMAGISQKISPEEVLPMLARNASLYGYNAGRPTEFLVLLDRYVHQARDLEHLSDANGVIRIAGCNDAADLLRILGYR